MIAQQKSFTFIKAPNFYEIPFFQRNYVWELENWQELLENLLDPNQNSFLGSIILKQKNTGSSEIAAFTIIDGQQRLTTLSILLRACFDSLIQSQDKNQEKFSSDAVANLTMTMYSQLFVTIDSFTAEREVKIKHSHIDSPSYTKIIKGEYTTTENLDEIILPEEASKDKKASIDKILLCYKFFRSRLDELGSNEMKRLWNVLTQEKYSFLVNIDLGAQENEQAIFDTVNTAGVRLTSADTIKNAIFQRYIDILRSVDKNANVQEAIDLYKENWEAVFSDSIETAIYWAKSRPLGRFFRDNIEILLHSIAMIEGFYNPSVNKMSELSSKYKDKIAKMSKEELKVFILKIKKYGELYRTNFIDIDRSTSYQFENFFLRLIHICDVLEVSTFHPYILKLLYQKDNDDSAFFKERCEQLERYILVSAICKTTSKNYNKECMQLIKGEKTSNELVESEDINEKKFSMGLNQMYSNKMATLILFWIELFNRYHLNCDQKELKYVFTLEHIMPQKWREYWKVSIPVSINNVMINDFDYGEELRAEAVYKIGNMTLLNSKLNTSLRNYEFTRKVKGDGTKRGMKDLADLLIISLQ